MAPIAKAAKSLNKSTPPRTFEFSVGHPIGLTALDVDLIKVGDVVVHVRIAMLLYSYSWPAAV